MMMTLSYELSCLLLRVLHYGAVILLSLDLILDAVDNSFDALVCRPPETLFRFGVMFTLWPFLFDFSGHSANKDGFRDRDSKSALSRQQWPGQYDYCIARSQ
jgi:hypothetical protein